MFNVHYQSHKKILETRTKLIIKMIKLIYFDVTLVFTMFKKYEKNMLKFKIKYIQDNGFKGSCKLNS